MLVAVACQAKTVIQPCIHVIKAAARGGANIYVQWYCAPEIGQIEAISDRDAAKANVPTMVRIMPYTRATGPPFVRPAAKPLKFCQHGAFRASVGGCLRSHSFPRCQQRQRESQRGKEAKDSLL